MTDSAARIIFFTGSPLASTLTWSEPALSSPLLACFKGNSEVRLNEVLRPTAENVAPQWRTLPLERRHLPTGLTQPSYAEGLGYEQYFEADDGSSLVATELALPSLVGRDETHEDVSHFYEHSFAIHQETDLCTSRGLTSNDSSLENTFDTALESDIIDADDDPQIAVVKARLNRSNMSDLRDVPDARHLRSVSPQTVTIDLIVGVISISQPKLILTRRIQHVELVELIVGDETRAGFAINIWLDVQKPDDKKRVGMNAEESGLRAQTLRLRPRDIIFARNVALGSFMNKVSGQSLRKGVTTIDLVCRNKIDASDERGVFRSRDIDVESMSNAKMARIKKTRDWVANFVGERPRLLHGRGRMENSVISLPEDTQ